MFRSARFAKGDKEGFRKWFESLDEEAQQKWLSSQEEYSIKKGGNKPTKTASERVVSRYLANQR